MNVTWDEGRLRFQECFRRMREIIDFANVTLVSDDENVIRCLKFWVKVGMKEDWDEGRLG